MSNLPSGREQKNDFNEHLRQPLECHLYIFFSPIVSFTQFLFACSYQIHWKDPAGDPPPRYVSAANINKIHHKQCEMIVIFLSSVGVNLATSIAFFSLATLSEQLILYCLLVFVSFYWKHLFFTPLSLIKNKSILVFCS